MRQNNRDNKGDNRPTIPLSRGGGWDIPPYCGTRDTYEKSRHNESTGTP